METTIGETIECVCSKKIEVLYGSCGYVNCPICGMLLKVGACDA